MFWQGLVFGQGICLMNTTVMVCASLLVRCGISAPLYELLWFYVGVFFVFGGMLVGSTLKGVTLVDIRRSARISLASLPDSQGSFLIILSYSYTSITSASVLMQSSFVMVAILSYIFNHKRYSVRQYAGLFACVVGLAVLVVADMRNDDWHFDGSALGDFIVLAGSFLYSW